MNQRAHTPPEEASRRPPFAEVAIGCVGLALALALRLSLIDFASVDYQQYTRGWYHVIKTVGFSAFRYGFSNYNPPYLYLLYILARFLPDLPALVAIKIPSIGADFVIAWLAYRIVRLRHAGSSLPLLAAFSCLFAPTVVLNSAFWGQADALYCSALVACVYFLLDRRSMLALLLFGIAVAFKAQAAFLSPLLLALLLRRELAWKHMLLVPLVLILALLPALAAGRPLLDLLQIYLAQAGQGGELSQSAASSMSWIPVEFYTYFYPAGLILAAAAAFLFILVVYKSQAKLSPPLLLELALLSVMMMPFLLPKMHERFFYPADVLSIILVFYRPRLFLVPVAMIAISFFSYQPFLFHAEPVPIGLLAFGVLVLLTVLSRDSLGQLYPRDQEAYR